MAYFNLILQKDTLENPVLFVCIAMLADTLLRRVRTEKRIAA